MASVKSNLNSTTLFSLICFDLSVISKKRLLYFAADCRLFFSFSDCRTVAQSIVQIAVRIAAIVKLFAARLSPTTILFRNSSVVHRPFILFELAVRTKHAHRKCTVLALASVLLRNKHCCV